MFGWLGSKKNELKPFNKVKDVNEAGYQAAIAHLAKSAPMEWLLKDKANAEVTLCSLDISINRAGAEKTSQRLRLMIDGMSQDEYADWVKNTVFH